MVSDSEEKDHRIRSRNREACLSIWRDKFPNNLEKLREMLRAVGEFPFEKLMEDWISVKVERYYHLKRIEDNEKDNIRIKEILKGAGFNF